MINSQIVEYIKGQAAKGENEAKIRQDLTANGWSGADVDEAYRSINSGMMAPIGPITPTKKSSSGTIVFLVILVFLAVGGFFAYKYFVADKKESVESTIDIQIATTTDSTEGDSENVLTIPDSKFATSSPSTSASSSSSVKAVTTLSAEDITSIKFSVSKLKEAHLKKDEKLMAQYISKKTNELLAEIPAESKTQIWYTDVIYVGARVENGMVLVKMTSVKTDKTSETEEYLFVKEEGVWKIAIAEMFEVAMQQFLKESR